MSVRAWLACVLIVAAGCGGGAAATQPQARTAASEAAKPAGEKVDVEAMFARESPAATLQDVSAPDGSWKSRMEAAEPPVVEPQQGFTAFVAKLADSQMQCFVYPEGKDGGEVARLLIEATLDKAVTADNRRWMDVHGDQIEGWPYFVARAHYLMDKEGGKAAGDFKIAVSVRDETTVACLMDWPGYYASFERVVRSLLGSMDSAANRGIAAPHYVEIVRAGLPGRVLTLSRTTFAADGTKNSSGMEVIILPTGTLKTSDEATVERSANGRVVSGVYAEASMGQLDHQLQLSSTGDRYTVSGTLQDKPIAAEFSVKGGLPDDSRTKAVICSVRDGKQAKAEVPGYVPSIDPQRPSTLLVEKSPTPDAHVVITFGVAGTQLKAHTDEDCDLERGIMVTGPVTFPIERLWYRGPQP